MQNQDRFNPNGKALNNDDLVIKNSNNDTSETSPVENMLHGVDDEQNTANRDDFGEYSLFRIQWRDSWNYNNRTLFSVELSASNSPHNPNTRGK